MSSVAMMSASNFLACRARFQTCQRSGLPAIRCRGFPGKRVELQRAGIIATALFICKSDNYLYSFAQIARDPIRRAAIGQFIKPGLDADRARAAIMPAFHVDFLVADKERARKIDIVVA